MTISSPPVQPPSRSKAGTTVKPYIETPLTESAALSKAAGWYGHYDPSLPSFAPRQYRSSLLNRRSRIFLKHDLLQPSGSFKSRGLGHHMTASMSRLAPEDRGRVHFHCSSGGNAGLACAHAARALGRPATVVVPLSTTPAMVAKLRAAVVGGGGAVVQRGRVWAEADAHLRGEVVPAAERNGEISVYVPPFDHPLIWEGHGSIIDEVAAQLAAVGVARPHVVVCSSGGGGLFNGLADGIVRYGWDREGTTLLVMGTEGAGALHASRVAGELVTLPGITSKATSLGATRVSQRSFDLVSRHSDWITTAVISDAEAAMGSWRLADDEHIMVELACGVNAALCYGGRLEKALGRKVHPDDVVVIEVCGGSGVSVDLLAQWKHEYGHLDDELTKKEQKTVPSAVSNGTAE